jgi:hypothetical protein
VVGAGVGKLVGGRWSVGRNGIEENDCIVLFLFLQGMFFRLVVPGKARSCRCTVLYTFHGDRALSSLSLFKVQVKSCLVMSKTPPFFLPFELMSLLQCHRWIPLLHSASGTQS